MALAAVATAVLWLTAGLSANWAAYLAVVLAAVYGIVLMAYPGAPRSAAWESYWRVAVDVALISLLVAGTGGAASPFSALYLLAAFEAERSRAFAPFAAVAVAGYLAAIAVPAGSPAPLLSAPASLQAALIALACYLAWRLGAALRDAREESASRAASLASEETHGERLDAVVSRLGPALGLLGPEDVLQWAAETAREAVGAAYVHVVVLDGNLHRTVAEESLQASPSWWHPEVQRLVLWSSRSGEVLREETSLHGIEGFIAVPVGPEEGAGVGALLAGGGRSGEEEERILRRIALEAARALSGREEAPGGRDPISRLPNHSSLRRVLEKERHYEGQLTLLRAEIDGFRRYGQDHGPSAGEDLLRRLGGKLAAGQQRAFHTGAGEFVLLVSGGNGARVRRAALGLRGMVEEAARGSAVPLTARVGVHTVRGSDGAGWSPDEALAEAGRALERAKHLPEGIAYAPEPGETQEGEAMGVVPALVEAAEAHDPYLGEHMRSVSRLSRNLGRQLGLSGSRLETLATGALLHDVGKIGLPQSLLQKPGSLDDAEYETMKRHPDFGVNILEPIEELSYVLPTVRHHHERYDGGGYPAGLRDEEIPIEARITLVADALDSMVRDRAYRRGMPLESAVQEITAGSGTQFDPGVVAALLALLDSDSRSLGLAN